MQVFSDIDKFKCSGSTAVAIGKFDGIHKGHVKLLQQVLNEKKNGYEALAFTFERPIADFFTGGISQVLTTNEEKREYLSELGFDYEIIMPVNADTVSIAPEIFLRDIIAGKLHAGVIAAGPDLSFGRNGSGNFELLSKMADDSGYRALKVDKVRYSGEDISSTLVRDHVSSGDMEYAGQLLGHPYSVDGRVTYGRHLGRTLDMPTVNLEPEPFKLLPPFGVYFSDIIIGTDRYHGITNIGIKPTVTDEGKITVETYIYDFNDDLYGEKLRVELMHFHRSEIKFSDIFELKKQMHDDMLKGREYFQLR